MQRQRRTGRVGYRVEWSGIRAGWDAVWGDRCGQIRASWVLWREGAAEDGRNNAPIGRD